ncbi:MAG: PQQ-like beta-propeller repeat protein [Phycisphaerae bacterium]|nr:PQQ-like beta-propeller repeat protein [Phycisphaerae bacterium]
MNFRWLALMITVCLSITSFSLAGDWPNWRGPNYDGISTETDWNPKMLTEKKVLWDAQVGIGFSAVSIANGKAYTMGNINKNTDVIYCFDAITGKEIWRYEYAEDLNPKNYEGGCSATPTISDGKVYTISKTSKVFCLSAETGEVVWKKELPYEAPTWGIAGSALVVDEKVIFNLGKSGLALNKITGEIIWKSDNAKCGYATPVPYKSGETIEMAIFGKDSVMSIDLATGTVRWSYLWETKHDVNAADPIISGQEIFITSGYGHGAALIDIASKEPAKLWENKNMRSHMSGPVLINGYLYGIDDNQLACLDWQTGEQKWVEKKTRKGALSAAGDKLIVISESGTLLIVQATPEGYQEIASADVLSSRCWTMPVFSDGHIYVRNAAGHLVCVDVQNKNEQ